MTVAAEHLHTPGENTRDDWKNTILAGLANYIDAGSINLSRRFYRTLMLP